MMGKCHICSGDHSARDCEVETPRPLTTADIPDIAEAVKNLQYTHAEEMLGVWKHRYYTVADVLAPTSAGPDDLANVLRGIRDERDSLKARLTTALAVVEAARKAWRRLSKENHPGKPPDCDCETCQLYGTLAAHDAGKGEPK